MSALLLFPFYFLAIYLPVEAPASALACIALGVIWVTYRWAQS